MAFKVYQGEVKDANLVTSKGTKSVFSHGSGNRVGFSLDPPSSSGTGGAKPTGQASDFFPIYVNEAGRAVTVAWDGTSGSQPAVAVPRTKPATVSTPTPGDWLVTPADDNMRDTQIHGPDIEADTPSGWQSGASIKFTTSRCGLDAFIVTYRYTDGGGKTQFAHVIVSVRKRIRCHLFEMKKSASTNDTFTQFRGPLGDVQTLLANTFGIDLVFPNNKIEAEQATAFQALRTTGQLGAMLPAPSAPGRDLWINVVNGINGTEDGLGGRSRAHVEIKKALDAKKTFEEWLQSWQQFERQGRGDKNDWVDRSFATRLPADQRKVALQLAGGVVTPQDLFDLNLRNLVLHEIGHALGLVPSNGQAGGYPQTSWVDSTGHCSTQSCVMNPGGGLSQLGLSAQLQKDTPFDHPKGSGCMVYLFACDLSDIRNFPQ